MFMSIVPLGDSITEITCWRSYVWDDIAAAGYADKVQYVGSQNSNPQNCKPKTSGWDEHHEGHSGWLAIDIANSYITGWMQKTPADIVMFMLGTNDIFRGHSNTDILAAYTKMVTVMRAANPKMKIIVRPHLLKSYTRPGIKLTSGSFRLILLSLPASTTHKSLPSTLPSQLGQRA
jgi:lysophospholipase L1-like esterase